MGITSFCPAHIDAHPWPVAGSEMHDGYDRRASPIQAREDDVPRYSGQSLTCAEGWRERDMGSVARVPEGGFVCDDAVVHAEFGDQLFV